MTRILLDNGADITSGDVGLFAYTAAEKNKLDLLKLIVSYGGDIRQPKRDRNTALHVAISRGNIEVVRFLLDHGAEIDECDANSRSPRDLADQQSNEEIKNLFCSKSKTKDVRYQGKLLAEVPPMSLECTSIAEMRRRPKAIQNLLFLIKPDENTNERSLE